MSTRAIIGIRRDDGSILGAWQWNDGNDLEDLLDRYFPTLESAMDLISVGVLDSLMTLDEAEDLKKTLRSMEIGFLYIPFHGAALVKAEPKGDFCEGVPCIYADLDDALAQDINFVYLWENGRWIKYE